MDPNGIFSKIVKEESERTSGAVKNYYNGIEKTVSSVTKMADLDMWPDVDKIDKLVEIWTVVGYSFGAASVVGGSYLLLRLTREIGQWRSWLRFRARRK